MPTLRYCPLRRLQTSIKPSVIWRLGFLLAKTQIAEHQQLTSTTAPSSPSAVAVAFGALPLAWRRRSRCAQLIATVAASVPRARRIASYHRSRATLALDLAHPHVVGQSFEGRPSWLNTTARSSSRRHELCVAVAASRAPRRGAAREAAARVVVRVARFRHAVTGVDEAREARAERSALCRRRAHCQSAPARCAGCRASARTSRQQAQDAARQRRPRLAFAVVREGLGVRQHDLARSAARLRSDHVQVAHLLHVELLRRARRPRRALHGEARRVLWRNPVLRVALPRHARPRLPARRILAQRGSRSRSTNATRPKARRSFLTVASGRFASTSAHRPSAIASATSARAARMAAANMLSSTAML